MPRSRWAGVAAALAVLACTNASSARAETVLSRDGSHVNMFASGSSASGTSPGRAIVEHFADASRNGIRIRQIGFGDPSIRLADADPSCQANPVFNDVVCAITPTSFGVTGSALNDEFVFGGSNQGCAATSGISVFVNLKEGDDILRVSTACVGDQSGINRLHPFFDARGAEGRDTMTGGRLSDNLDGGPGADVLDGGSGNDNLRGGLGADRVIGSNGNDTFLEQDEGSANPLFADVLDGGNGTDTADYRLRSSRISITLDGNADDGESGEGDNVVGVENVVAGSRNDTLIGADGANRLEGGAGNDEIIGRNGADALFGGDGDDVIDARDNGTKDVVDCGIGFDEVIADLQDEVPTRLEALRPGSACERIERFAVDDGPPGQVANRSVTIARDGSLSVSLACPRRARVACRGTLRLVDARRPNRTLASARYTAGRGRQSVPIRLRLSPTEVRLVQARGIITAITRERGVSKRGPRSATNTLTIR